MEVGDLHSGRSTIILRVFSATRKAARMKQKMRLKGKNISKSSKMFLFVITVRGVTGDCLPAGVVRCG